MLVSVEVIYTDEFGSWYEGLTEAEQDDVVTVVDMLEQAGVALGFPASSALKGAKYALRELRPNQGEPTVRRLRLSTPPRRGVDRRDKAGDPRFCKRVRAAEIGRTTRRARCTSVEEGEAMKLHKWSDLKKRMSPQRRSRAASRRSCSS